MRSGLGGLRKRWQLTEIREIKAGVSFINSKVKLNLRCVVDTLGLSRDCTLKSTGDPEKPAIPI